MILYLDTSALVKLYLDEEDSGAVHEAVEVAEGVATSTVAYAETRAAFARRERFGDLGFLAFDARLVEAARATSISVFEGT